MYLYISIYPGKEQSFRRGLVALDHIIFKYQIFYGYFFKCVKTIMNIAYWQGSSQKVPLQKWIYAACVLRLWCSEYCTCASCTYVQNMCKLHLCAEHVQAALMCRTCASCTYVQAALMCKLHLCASFCHTSYMRNMYATGLLHKCLLHVCILLQCCVHATCTHASY